MGISGISPISGYSSYYPVYDAAPVSPVRASSKLARGTDGVAQAAADGAKDAENAAGPKRNKRIGKQECQTCKNRKYVDGSNESNVSFKSPAHINPASSASVVMGHEREHMSNAVAEGSENNKELVSASIRLKTSVCPECGRVYVSGGETSTTIRTEKKSPAPSNPYEKNQKNLDYLMASGANMDLSA